MALGVYLHIPFCQKKCPYCDFFSIPFTAETADRYTDALCAAIASYRPRRLSADTVYFGGGTPNLLGSRNTEKIISALYENIDIDPGSEITMEANPETLSTQNIQAFADLNINRFSLGLQSANKTELDFLGRTHTPAQVAYCVDELHKCGISNISLDLMLALQNQSIEDIEKSVRFCASLGVTHISCYLLKIEKQTVFYKKASEFHLPDDDTISDIYIETCEMLEQYGYKQYEISNFAKDGYPSRHNLKYWSCEEYIGIGAAAHGFLDKKRYYYKRSVKDFIDNPLSFVLDSEGGGAQEEFMLRLRLCKGINLDAFCKRFSISFPENFYKKIDALKKVGYVHYDNAVLSLTKKGFIVSNAVILDLMRSME